MEVDRNSDGTRQVDIVAEFAVCPGAVLTLRRSIASQATAQRIDQPVAAANDLVDLTLRDTGQNLRPRLSVVAERDPRIGGIRCVQAGRNLNSRTQAGVDEQSTVSIGHQIHHTGLLGRTQRGHQPNAVRRIGINDDAVAEAVF